MKPDLADVTFVVKGQRIPAHKLVLATQSSYFREKLCNGSVETPQIEIELDIHLEAFKSILHFCYSGRLQLAHKTTEDVMNIWILTNRYGFDTLKPLISECFALGLSSVNMKTEDLMKILILTHQRGIENLKLSISERLISDLSLETCINILNSKELYGFDALRDICIRFMDRKATELLGDVAFQKLSQDALCCLLKRDSFYAPENEIIKAVCDWSKNNPTANIQVKSKIINFTSGYSVVNSNFSCFLNRL